MLKYFHIFTQKTGFDISCKLPPMETICMKYQILFFWEKNKKNITNLLSELTQRERERVVMLNEICIPVKYLTLVMLNILRCHTHF